MNVLLYRFKRLIKLQKKPPIVCFDYFDTIVSRKVSPEEIKRSWAKHFSNFLSLNISWQDLYELRITIEKELYRSPQLNFEFEYQTLIKNIFNYLKNNHPNAIKGFSEYECLKYSIMCETRIELGAQYKNEDVVDVIKYCKNRGLKMCIVSDFYFGKEYIKRFLSKFDLADYFFDIFVSCDLHKSKKNNDIYEYIKNSMPCDNYIMIGDNEKVDIQNSRSNGFHPLLIQRSKQILEYNLYEKDSLNIISHKLRNIDKKSGHFLSNYAFALYLFIERLYYTAYKENIYDLYFFSREGEFLKILFDIYAENRSFYPGIQAHYLLVSRNSTYLPSCNPLREENFDGVFSHYSTNNIADFLISLSFDNKQIVQIIEEMGVSKDTVFLSSDSDFISRMIHLESFSKYYEINRKKVKSIFLKYLQQEIKNIDSFAIVDIGWRGTIQDNIFKVLNGKSKINGFYYGLAKKRNVTNNNMKRGLVFSYDSPQDMIYETFAFEYWFIENVLTGSHGKVIGYRYDNNQVRATFEPDSDCILYERVIKSLRKEIIHKFKEIDTTLLTTRYDSSSFVKLFAQIHFETSRFYPIKEKRENYIIRRLHAEGFGIITSPDKISSKGWKNYYNMHYGKKYEKKVKRDFDTLNNYLNEET